MVREIKSTPLRYALALGSFALILLVSFGLQRVIPFRVDLTFAIIIAMIATAWYLGRGPGLLFAVVFELTLDYFSTAPLTMRSSIVIFNRLVLFVSLVLFASSRRAAERRLREQREWLQVTLASIGDAVIATDVKGLVNFINPVAASLTGWSLKDAAHKPLDEVFRIVNEETREPVESAFSKIRREGVSVGLANHTILISKDGRELPIEDSGAPIRDPEGNIVGVIVVFHDVSEHRRADREREELLVREREARHEAETADRLKDEFLATVSHELRTPLTVILGWSGMLRLNQFDTQALQYGIGIIERNAKAQSEIISDILDVSHIITGKLNLDSRLVDLTPVLRAVVDSQRLAATAKYISISLVIASDKNLVSGDSDRLRQIAWNLLSNAIKFTPKGGSIEVRLERLASQVQLKISDTGIGIDKQFLPHAFERFRQADSSTTREHGGLGLGLAIVRHLVELHGGTVVADEGRNQGAVFTVVLPLATDNDEPIAQEGSSELEDSKATHDLIAASPDLSGLRVLVVDDEPDNLQILVEMLNQYGANVRPAQSSEKAFETFMEWQPDVLISDLGMPGEDGYSLIGRVRGLSPQEGGNTPAAALTAHVREENRLRALAAGYQTHVKKPIDPNTLATIVATLGKRAKVETQ